MDTIESIDFGVFPAEEINKLAVCKVVASTTHVGSLPANGGTLDARMGTTDRRLRCSTCKRSCTSCIGHLGSIPLAYPIYHPNYLDTVFKILRCVCFFCSSLILSDSHIQQISKLSQKKKLPTAAGFAKNRKACASCGAVNPIYSKSGLLIKADFTKNVFEDPEEENYCMRPFTSSEARTILQNVSSADALLLGFACKLEDFVITVLPVPPPIIRPSVTISDLSKSRGNDDITVKLSEVVKVNKAMDVIISRESNTHGLSIAGLNALSDLTLAVGSFINGDIRQTRYQRSGQPVKSIMSRLKGKDGRIRGTLMGKRVNFSSRSVVSPDPLIDMTTIGVPEKVANTLTIPVKVIDINISELRMMVSTGKAYSVIKNNNIIVLEFADRDKESQGLCIGDTVERFMRDGDHILFNRQPSLHRGSMLGFKVKIMRHNTFRVNMIVSQSFNLDFDGDELNLHLLQSLESQVECSQIMAAHRQIVSPSGNKPVIGLVQDSLLGAYIISDDSIRFTRLQMVDLMGSIYYGRKKLPPPPYTGKKAFELCLPENFSYNNGKIKIVNGKFISGRLDKSSLGTSYGSIAHRIWLKDTQLAAHLLSDIQRLIVRFLLYHSFSVRFSDCLATPETKEQVDKMILLAEEKTRTVVDTGLKNIEGACAEIANAALTNVGKVVHSKLPESNSLYRCVTSGSKGNLINIAQICGAVGQQVVNGERLHGLRFDTQSLLKPYGFISSSYVDGLSPEEFYMHKCAGRSGLIDTACRTAVSGYTQRRLIKALESIQISPDRTVRNSRGDIIQLRYGGDDFDACFVQRHSLEFLKSDDVTLEEHEAILYNNLKSWLKPHLLHDSVAYVPVEFPSSPPISGKRVNPEETLVWLNDLVETVCQMRFGRRRIFEMLLRHHYRHEISCCIDRNAVSKSIIKQYRKSLVDVGEPVGPVGSHSISQNLTQLVLNTFHSAGVASKNPCLSGIPRIKELIDLSKTLKTPTMTIVPKMHSVNFRSSLPYLTLGDCIQHFEITYTPIFNQGLIYDYYIALYGEPNKFNPYLTVCKLRKEVLISRYLRPEDIAEIVGCHINQAVVLSSLDNDWFLHIRLLYNDGDDIFLEQLTCDVIDRACRDVAIGGIPDVKAISDDYVCSGTNLMVALSTEGVETASCNSIHDTYNTLGLEAALRVLFDELQTTISFDGSYTNARHISLLVALIGYNKNLCAISRHGLNRLENASVLAKSSFEETVDQLVFASLYSETDRIQGISEAVAVGARANVGTGAVEVLSKNKEAIIEDACEDDEVVFTEINQTQTWVTQSTLEPPFWPGSSFMSNSFVANNSSTYQPSSPRQAFLT